MNLTDRFRFLSGGVCMCCFSQPVLSVNNTRIFARLSGQGTQFLAYQMNYESRDPNAMILPLPIQQPATDSSLRFIDLKDYDTFFKDLASGFPTLARSFSIGCGLPGDPANRSDLEVFEVGNYIASFVPTIQDFDRLDPVFTLPRQTWDRIPEYNDFGFAVFQLAAGSLEPHPMAFEFQSRDNKVFFPTIHIHDGQVHETEEFDHALYAQHAGLDSQVYGYINSDVHDDATGLIRSAAPAAKFCNVEKSAGLIDGDLLVHRTFLFGKSRNIDTVFVWPGDPVRPTPNLRPWLSRAPWLIPLAGLVWYFNRRARLKKHRNAPAEDSSLGPTD